MFRPLSWTCNLSVARRSSFFPYFWKQGSFIFLAFCLHSQLLSPVLMQHGHRCGNSNTTLAFAALSMYLPRVSEGDMLLSVSALKKLFVTGCTQVSFWLLVYKMYNRQHARDPPWKLYNYDTVSVVDQGRWSPSLITLISLICQIRGNPSRNHFFFSHTDTYLICGKCCQRTA